MIEKWEDDDKMGFVPLYSFMFQFYTLKAKLVIYLTGICQNL